MPKSRTIINTAVRVISVGMVVYAVLNFTRALFFLNIQPNYTAHRAIFLAFLLPLIFITRDGRRRTRTEAIAWYDIILILVALAACLYPVFFFDLYTLHATRVELTLLEEVLAFGLILVVLEAARRTLGWPLTLIALFFVIYPLLCQYFPSVLHGRGYSIERITQEFFLLHNSIFGIAVGVAATEIIAFMILTQILLQAGAGDVFTMTASNLLGRTRGRGAKVSVISSALVGTITGSGAANVATTGPFTIPLMKKEGFKPTVAGAVECVASNGGHFMPPVMGASVFIMADITKIPYSQICIYAAIPAILYYLSLLLQVDLMARRDNLLLDTSRRAPTKEVMKQLAPYILPMVVLVFLLIVLRFPVTTAASATILLTLLCTQIPRRTRFSLSGWVNVALGVGKIMCVVGIACAAADIIICSVTLTGMGQRIGMAVTMLAGGSTIALLLITAIGCYILGMGSGAIVLYITVALLIVPTLVQMGIVLIAAHLFAYMMACTAFITPPVALNCFVAAPLAEASPNKIGWESMKLGMVIYILPFLFCYKPALLTIGTPGEIALAVVTCAAGLVAAAFAIVGYLSRRLSWWERVAFALAALLLIWPSPQLNLMGAVIGTGMVLWCTRLRIRRTVVRGPSA